MFEKLEQMDKRTIVRLAIAAIVGILIFGAITNGIHQSGWNEGYTAGLMVNNGDGAKTAAPLLTNPGVYGPAAQWHGGYGWGGHSGFGFIGGVFRFLFFGFLIMMAFKFFAFRRWRHQGGGPDGGQGGPWQHRGGPWGQHRGPWGQQPGQQPEQPQATQGNNPTGNAPQATENKPENISWINV
ncbi:hypothetical protein BH10CHL1_BH10CHL1_31240 [soil metagenome]